MPVPSRPRRTVRVGLALTLLAAPALAACGGGGTPEKNTGGAAPEQLTLALGGEPDEGFDPTLGWGRYGSPLFQSTLLQRNPDLSIAGDLATDWKVSKDGLTWTVDLRDDAAFTTGEPVTAADVAYTYTTAAKSGGLTDLTMLEKASAVDEDTVELTLTRPTSTFVNRMVALGIVPAEGHDRGYGRAPVGSGPYEFVSWQPGQQLVVERNDDYYGTMPAFERLTFLFTDEDTSLAALRTGEVDVAGVPASMAGEKIDGHRVVAVPSLDNRAVSFPTVLDTGRTSSTGAPVGNDVTADVAVRRAVNVAVDRAALVEGVLDGHGSPAFGPVDEAPWFEPSTTITDDDTAGAQALLEDAGWTDGDGDGVREKDGTRAELTLLYPAGDTVRQNLALAVADMLDPIGLDVTARSASWEKIEERMHADPVLFGWGSQDQTELYNILSGTQRGVEYNNPGYYADAQVDRHLEAAMRATDPETAEREWKAAQVESGPAADAPWAWLVNLDHTYYVDECLDLGETVTEPHGHGWPLTAGITGWSWTC